MKSRWLWGAAIVAVTTGLTITAHSQSQNSVGGPDAVAIRRSSEDFAAAFNRGDAQALASQWTESGECRDADGRSFVGRAAIEKAFADSFKANPDAKIELLVQSIR